MISELRNITDFSHLSNELIAKLNDLAYSAINKGSLNKLVDKRAIANEDLYQKLEKELTE